jgi:hypothetical protein
MAYDLPSTSPPLPDEEQTKEVEVRMRRSLGLVTSSNGSTPPLSSDPLKAARQAIRSQATAREHAERQLAQAQAAVRELHSKLHHARVDKDAAEEAARLATATKITAERTLVATEAALTAEKVARERGTRALQDAQVTIRELQGKLDTAVQALQAVQAELAAERQARQMAEDNARAALTVDQTTPVEGREETSPTARKKIAGTRQKKMPAHPACKSTARFGKASASGRKMVKNSANRIRAVAPTVRRLTERSQKKASGGQAAHRPANRSPKAPAPRNAAPKKADKQKKISAKTGRRVQARAGNPIKRLKGR